MFINEAEINFNDFQNMCRTCLKNTNLNSIKNNFLIEVLHNITDINYRIDEDLPQRICDTCVQKIDEIRAFAFQCIEIDLTLRKRRNAVKENIKIEAKNEPETEETIKEEEEHTNIQFNEIKDVTFDENVIEIEDNENCAQGGNYDKWFQNSNDVNYSCVAFAKHDSDAESDHSTNNLIIENRDSLKNLKNLKTVSNRKKSEFKCETCAKPYKTKNGLKRHRELFPDIHYCCDVCQHVYTRLSGLRMHKKMHQLSGILVCDVCNKFFYKERKLREHKKKVHRNYS